MGDNKRTANCMVDKSEPGGNIVCPVHTVHACKCIIQNTKSLRCCSQYALAKRVVTEFDETPIAECLELYDSIAPTYTHLIPPGDIEYIQDHVMSCEVDIHQWYLMALTEAGLPTTTVNETCLYSTTVLHIVQLNDHVHHFIILQSPEHHFALDKDLEEIGWHRTQIYCTEATMDHYHISHINEVANEDVFLLSRTPPTRKLTLPQGFRSRKPRRGFSTPKDHPLQEGNHMAAHFH